MKNQLLHQLKIEIYTWHTQKYNDTRHQGEKARDILQKQNKYIK